MSRETISRRNNAKSAERLESGACQVPLIIFEIKQILFDFMECKCVLIIETRILLEIFICLFMLEFVSADIFFTRFYY